MAPAPGEHPHGGDHPQRAPDVYVGVVGPHEARPEELQWAEAVGAGIGARGVTLVCGGLGGVMEAACRGAHAAGGRTLAILPGEQRSAANPFVDVAVATGMGEMRNALIARCADVLIAVGGAFGTLSEIAFALRIETPVVGLGTWELARGGSPDASIVRARDPEDAVARALALAGG